MSNVREDIREMSDDKRERYAQAIETMFQNGDYARNAKYHDTHCKHGEETFPGWHRAYLHAFEQDFQKADRDNGKDGNIGLPYWDWSRDVNGERFPQWINKRWPEPNMKGISSSDRKGLRYAINSDGAIKKGIARQRSVKQAYDSLYVNEHWKVASKRWGRGTNIEGAHDGIHVIVGAPMPSVSLAAFHPIFFLHHCNVDRIYESYLKENPDSSEEFASQQQGLARKNEENRFTTPLEPFKLNGRNFMPADTFAIEKLGYHYDQLLGLQPQQMREMPTYALYSVDIKVLMKKSYELHVFVVHEDQAQSFRVPTIDDSLERCPQYGGSGAIFGGKDPSKCKNCSTRKPFTVKVDITKALTSQNLSRSRAHIITHAIEMDEYGVVTQEFLLSSDQVPAGMHQPTLAGPLFESETVLSKTLASYDNEHDSSALQGYLKRFGYYEGEIDGDFGDKTEAALKKFQRCHGLPVTGELDSTTREQMTTSRLDGDKDHGAEAQPVPNYPPKSVISWYVDSVPAYMKKNGKSARDCVIEEVEMAFAAWAVPLAKFGVKFRQAQSVEHAVAVINFPDNLHGAVAERFKKYHLDKEGHEEKTAQSVNPADILGFDGPGGELAHTTKSKLDFDRGEDWLLQGQESKSQYGRGFLEVCMHEIGHLLGLAHSTMATSLMAPYYVKGRISLQKEDVDALVTMYTTTDFSTYAAPPGSGGMCSCFGF